MSIGEGIFWSTALVLIFVIGYQLSVRGKWVKVGKLTAILILIGILGGVGFWQWDAYENRPRLIKEFIGIRIDMAPVDVKLAKGAPTKEGDIKKIEDESEERKYRIGS